MSLINIESSTNAASDTISTDVAFGTTSVTAAFGTTSVTAASNDTVATCPVCPHACTLKEGRFGACGARRASGGVVVADNYGKLTSLALDPIEKKPLVRYHPGAMILSAGSYGCNLNCSFCQNSDISRMHGNRLSGRINESTPENLVEAAVSLKSRGNIGLAYTYNEPLVGFEFILDTARLAHEAGLLNVIVSNGYINEPVFRELLSHLDAANIDLKAFSQKFYDMVGAPEGLKTVKRSIALAAQFIHVEVTTLIIPGLNDSVEEIDELTAWLAGIDASIPYHLSRFHPSYRMLDKPPTPRSTILKLTEIAQKHLKYVYTGNI